MRESLTAHALACVIALRARWQPGINRFGLEVGEAFIGDHRECGLTEQEYRTAKKTLERCGFATFKPTTKGTIAKLSDSSLFDICGYGSNEQNNERLTDDQRKGNEQLTTNEEGKEGKAQGLIRSALSEGVQGEKVRKQKKLRRKDDLWQRLKAIIKEPKRHPHFGHWLQLDTDKFERVLEHVEHELKRSDARPERPVGDVGAFLSYTWNEFKGESDAGSKGPSR